LGGHKGAFCLSSRVSNPLKTDWQRHVLASSGYLELGMFDAAALVLEEVAPEDKNRNEVLGERTALFMAAKKWDMAAAVASHLVKVEPENAAWWISLAYSVRRGRGCREGGSHSAAGAIDTSQSCHDRFQPGLLRKRHRSHGGHQGAKTRGLVCLGIRL
jgi:hypothetical protein